jgi:acyl phosphate:glycerol-3-phosphate acyltransferase
VQSGWVVSVGAVLLAYLVGTIPSAQIVARRSGHDPTAEGSHNPGASNVYRLAGRRAGAVVLAADLGKGAGATLAGWAVGGRELALACGAAAVLGHVAPATRGFRGGKGVATAGGMALVLWPVTSAVLFGVFLALALTVRISSVGSLAMAVGLPIGVAIETRSAVEAALAAAVALVVISRHHENIGRLIRGDERATTPPDPDLDRPADTAP